MSNIKPLGQRVLVKRVETETKSAGGIILVDSAQEKPQEALVIATGVGAKNEDGSTFEFTVNVNDRVIISKYGGTEVKVEGEDHLILNESDILGIVS